LSAAPLAARARLLLAVLGFALVTGCTSTASADVPAAAPIAAKLGWVASWGTAMQASAPPVRASAYTVRDIVHLSVPGSHVRLWLSNVFGHTPLRIGQVTVAPAGQADKPDTTATPQEVTFGGSASVSVLSGEQRVSDPVALNVGPGANLLVSLYITTQPDIATAHVTANTRAYLASTGADDAGDTDGSAFVGQQNAWYFLTGVDTFDPAARGTVVAFGDSLTDGEQSTFAANDRWPDVLAQRLLALPPDQQYGIVNSGISGNQIGQTTSDGMSAVLREQRDVLMRTGVSTAILFEGINDIQGGAITMSTVDDLERDYRTIAGVAHAAHIRILCATVTPFGGSPNYTPNAELVREKINDFIRHSGVFDGVLDLDSALRDPHDPTRLLDTYASPDHLHLNDAGYRRIGDLIPLDELR
jgi:lysophospholipase L1-like esterase